MPWEKRTTHKDWQLWEDDATGNFAGTMTMSLQYPYREPTAPLEEKVKGEPERKVRGMIDEKMGMELGEHAYAITPGPEPTGLEVTPAAKPVEAVPTVLPWAISRRSSSSSSHSSHSNPGTRSLTRNGRVRAPDRHRKG